MRNPGYVHELAEIYLDGGGEETVKLAETNGVDKADLHAAMRALKAFDAEGRKAKIHEIYVIDAGEKGYAYGDPTMETTWVLAQRAMEYYQREEQ